MSSFHVLHGTMEKIHLIHEIASLLQCSLDGAEFDLPNYPRASKIRLIHEGISAGQFHVFRATLNENVSGFINAGSFEFTFEASDFFGLLL